MNEPSPSAPEPFGLQEAKPSPGGQQPPDSNDKILAGLSYVSQIILPAVLPAILLLTGEGKRSSFIRHHAVQSLGLLVATVLYEILMGILFVVVSALVPCLACGIWIIFLLPLVPAIYYGWLAFQGQYVNIPWLTHFMTKNALL